MKLLGRTENKITKDKICENTPHLEITEEILVHLKIVNNDYQQDSSILYIFVPDKSFHQFSRFHQQILHFESLHFESHLIQSFFIYYLYFFIYYINMVYRPI